MKLTELLKESKLNENNPRLNTKVKKYLDAYLVGTSASDPEFHHAIAVILRGALTDANFHSESKKVDALFRKAKDAKYYKNASWEDNLESKGRDISKWAKWDGHDIIDAFVFYTSMTIGGGFGNKLSALKESFNEAVNEASNSDVQTANDFFNGKSGITLDKQFKGKYNKSIFNKFMDVRFKKSNRLKRPSSLIKIWSELLDLNPTDYLSGDVIEDVDFIKDAGDRVDALYKIYKSSNEAVNESMNIYFASFTEASEAARNMAEKRGYTIDEDDWQTQVSLGGKYTRSRPSPGQTTSFTVGLSKNGKPQRKALSFQVYGMARGKYELTGYIN